jgi:hypothetical protein
VPQALLALVAPRHPRVLRNQNHAPNTGGLAISWVEALKNLDTETAQGTEIETDAAAASASELSESLTQQGDKSAKRGDEGLQALLSPLHVGDSEIYAPRKEHRTKGDSTKERPWLDALKGLEEKAAPEGKSRTNTALSSLDDMLPC